MSTLRIGKYGTNCGINNAGEMEKARKQDIGFQARQWNLMTRGSGRLQPIYELVRGSDRLADLRFNTNTDYVNGFLCGGALT